MLVESVSVELLRFTDSGFLGVTLLGGDDFAGDE
jgi:hypothetical protein